MTAFKVGDKVKVTGTVYYGHCFPVGYVGSIIEYHKVWDEAFRVECNDKRQWLHKDDLEKVSSNPGVDCIF